MPNGMIRVLQVGMSTNYGGTESIVYEIYRNIDRTKIQFDFLNVYDEPLARQDWLESLGARILPLKLRRRQGYFKYLRGIKSFYKKHASEFGVVVCNVQCLDQIAMVKYAKKFGVPKTILHLHNSNFGIQPSRLARVAISWNKRHCHSYVDQFVAVSSMAANWGFANRDAAKAYILQHGVSIEAMCYDPNKRKEFRSRFGYSDNNRLYGSVGRLDPQKNQLFLIAIFEAIATKDEFSRFVLLGRGPLETDIKNRILESPVADRIALIPQIDDIGVFYSGIDVFLLPSLFEGLGLVLVEAQCSGLPCLATQGTIPSEVGLSRDFSFLRLSDGPMKWAEVAIHSAVTSGPREDGHKRITESGRDIMETCKDYCKLLL